jgi:hypothetical protein
VVKIPYFVIHSPIFGSNVHAAPNFFWFLGFYGQKVHSDWFVLLWKISKRLRPHCIYEKTDRFFFKDFLFLLGTRMQTFATISENLAQYQTTISTSLLVHVFSRSSHALSNLKNSRHPSEKVFISWQSARHLMRRSPCGKEILLSPRLTGNRGAQSQ